MGKIVKWGIVIVGGLVVLLLAALVLVPLFVDINQYKPEIERRVTEATGRPFRLGGDLKLSLFPWAGVSLSELHLGNPPGFEEEEFLSIRSFEVRVKFLPLLSRDIQIKRFVMESPKIVLVRNKEGRANWEGPGKGAGSKVPPGKREREGWKEEVPRAGLPIKGLAVEEFSIKEGSVMWIDHLKGDRKEVRDLTLRLEDVSLSRPMRIHLSAKLDGQPVSVEGEVGPAGKEPGMGTLPVALTLKLLEELEAKVHGKLIDPVADLRFDLALEVSPFSPRRVLSRLGQALPVQPADPDVLQKLAFTARISGSPRAMSLSSGALEIDQSRITFEAEARDLHKPDLRFRVKVDGLDLDRYLPPPPEQKSESGPGGEGEGRRRPGKKRKDDSPLRRLVLDGTVDIGRLKVHGAEMQDMHIRVLAKGGVIRIDPLRLKLYRGGLNAAASVDVRGETPRSRLSLELKGVQSGPLLRDVARKDFIEGLMNARVNLTLQGDDAERIKRTLNGKGDLLFLDGAIKGIDLAGMVRNIKETFTLSRPSGGGSERPRTDFAELRVPFSLTNGIFKTSGAVLKSPLLRVRAAGKAHLAEETLDFSVEPKFVATLKGQGDTVERSGLMVPVLVRGTFEYPTFAPDLEGIVKGMIPKPSAVEKLLPFSGKTETPQASPPPGEQIKGLMKRLLPLGGE